MAQSNKERQRAWTMRQRRNREKLRAVAPKATAIITSATKAQEQPAHLEAALISIIETANGILAISNGEA